MRYTDSIGSPKDFIERKLNRPKYSACPQCGRKGKRKRVIERFVKHIGPLNRRSWIHAKVGVYQARCNCCKFFQAEIEGVPYKGHYSRRCPDAGQQRVTILLILKRLIGLSGAFLWIG